MDRDRATVARRALTLVVTAFVVLASAGPAAGQYGGAVDVLVDPVRVEVDGTFEYIGTACPAASTVTITIDGVPGVVDTTVAADDSSFAGTGATLPDDAVPGQDLVVRASCGGESDTTVIRVVCNDGNDPVDGECPGGDVVGGGDPTTTTTPGGGSTQDGGSQDDGSQDGSTQDGGTPGPGNGSSDQGDPGGDADLAVTGASFVERALRVGVTLVALGAIVVLLATTRRSPATA